MPSDDQAIDMNAIKARFKDCLLVGTTNPAWKPTPVHKLWVQLLTGLEVDPLPTFDDDQDPTGSFISDAKQGVAVSILQLAFFSRNLDLFNIAVPSFWRYEKRMLRRHSELSTLWDSLPKVDWSQISPADAAVYLAGLVCIFGAGPRLGRAVQMLVKPNSAAVYKELCERTTAHLVRWKFRKAKRSPILLPLSTRFVRAMDLAELKEVRMCSPPADKAIRSFLVRKLLDKPILHCQMSKIYEPIVSVARCLLDDFFGKLQHAGERKTVERKTANLAFVVDQACVRLVRKLTNDHRTLFHLQIKGPAERSYATVVDARTMAELKHEQDWVFIRHGARVDRSVPYLKHLVPAKFNGTVPKLRFQLVHSEGLLVPFSALALGAVYNGLHVDLTEPLALFERKVRKAVPELRSGLWARRFPIRTFVQPALLFAFREHWFDWDNRQKILFTTAVGQFSRMPQRLVPDELFLLEVLKFLFNQPNPPIPIKNLTAPFCQSIESYSDRLPSQAQAVIAFKTSGPRNLLLTLAKFFGRPTFVHLFNLIGSSGVRVQVPQTAAQVSANGFKLLAMLRCESLPGNFRRLCWQTLHDHSAAGNLAIRVNGHHNITEIKGLLDPIRVSLPFPALAAVSTTLTFDPVKHSFLEIKTISRAWNQKLHPWQFDVRIRGEPAMGPSVFQTVLQIAWKHAIRANMLVPEDDGTYCMGRFPVTVDETSNQIMSLGLITGICLANGLSLPFKISRSWWNLTLSVGNVPFDPFDMMSAFSGKVIRYAEEFKSLSNEELQATLCLDRPIGNRQDFIVDNYLPDPLFLFQFAKAFMACLNGPRLDLLVDGDLNKIFYVDKLPITLEAVLKAFDSPDTVRKRTIWVPWLKSLSVPKLRRLIFFVTGEARIPDESMGEVRMRVVWDNARTGSLPIAQNCVNQIVLPREADSVRALDRLMEPVFKFEVAFGMA